MELGIVKALSVTHNSQVACSLLVLQRVQRFCFDVCIFNTW